MEGREGVERDGKGKKGKGREGAKGGEMIFVHGPPSS